MTVFSQTEVIGVRAGVTPCHKPEQLADLTYYVEGSAADGKDTSVSKLLSAALTGNSSEEPMPRNLPWMMAKPRRSQQQVEMDSSPGNLHLKIGRAHV